MFGDRHQEAGAAGAASDARYECRIRAQCVQKRKCAAIDPQKEQQHDGNDRKRRQTLVGREVGGRAVPIQEAQDTDDKHSVCEDVHTAELRFQISWQDPTDKLEWSIRFV